MPSTPFFYVNNKKTDMRRILSTIFAILLTASAFAQSHGNHIMVGVGGSYPQGVEATSPTSTKPSITTPGNISPQPT